jgi:hypothetical protein
MRYLIESKFLAFTNHRGARVKAWSPSGMSLIFPWDHAQDPESNFRLTSVELVKRLMAANHDLDDWTFFVGDSGYLKNSFLTVVKVVPRQESTQ